MQGLFDEQDSETQSSDQQFPAAENPTRENWPDEQPKPQEPVVTVPFQPVSTAENVRRMGLAWSAGVAFTGAIVFMLFIGWIADLVLGSSPWGLVGGIILGAIIGFIQFFRISSQIFKTNSDIPAVHPLHVADPDDESRD
jgi:hypothetical protein